MIFDRVAILDWSAANRPCRGANSIWLGLDDGQAWNPATRTEAAGLLHRLVADALAQGQRLLIGADFAFGYPTGFAAALTGRADPLAVWAWLAAAIEDDAHNRSNRIAVAASINARLPGIGPFWFNPGRKDFADLPRKGLDRADHGLDDHRVTERASPGAQSVWKLGGAGAVGSQVLTGLPVLHRLRLAFPGQIAVWPFEPPTTPVILAEVFPSLLSEAVNAAMGPGAVKDAVQVRLLARALARLSARNALAPLFACPDDPAIAEEGWILGAGQQDLLREALA
ncbi:MAG: hypothetical protein Kow0013_02410 [Pararhodobacter sp.]